MKKNILAENMRRFNTKNLNEGPKNLDLAQKAYDRIYDFTSDFHGDYPLNYLDDNMPSELNMIADKFFDDSDLLSAEEDKKLADFFNEIANELANELKYR